jgi:hypothetical protein
MRTAARGDQTNCRSKGIHTLFTVVDIKQQRPPGAQLDVQIVRGNISRPGDQPQRLRRVPAKGPQVLPA